MKSFGFPPPTLARLPRRRHDFRPGRGHFPRPPVEFLINAQHDCGHQHGPYEECVEQRPAYQENAKLAQRPDLGDHQTAKEKKILKITQKYSLKSIKMIKKYQISQKKF